MHVRKLEYAIFEISNIHLDSEEVRTKCTSGFLSVLQLDIQICNEFTKKVVDIEGVIEKGNERKGKETNFI